MKKQVISIDITAIWYTRGERKSHAIFHRNVPENRWGVDNETEILSRYNITTKLRMLRCLALQSAFLAKDGAALK